jgi:hypothetical protein
MTDEERTTVFIAMQAGLRHNDDGLTPDNRLGYLNPLAKLCLDVKAITAAGDSPFQLALHRLATLTEDMIVTRFFPSRKTVHDWLIARAELLEVRLT